MESGHFFFFYGAQDLPPEPFTTGEHTHFIRRSVSPVSLKNVPRKKAVCAELSCLWYVKMKDWTGPEQSFKKQNKNNDSCHNNAADPNNGPKAWLCVRLTLGSRSKRQGWNPVHPHPVLRAFQSMTLEKGDGKARILEKMNQICKEVFYTLWKNFIFTCARKSERANREMETLLPNELWCKRTCDDIFLVSPSC